MFWEGSLRSSASHSAPPSQYSVSTSHHIPAATSTGIITNKKKKAKKNHTANLRKKVNLFSKPSSLERNSQQLREIISQQPFRVHLELVYLGPIYLEYCVSQDICLQLSVIYCVVYVLLCPILRTTCALFLQSVPCRSVWFVTFICLYLI